MNIVDKTLKHWKSTRINKTHADFIDNESKISVEMLKAMDMVMGLVLALPEIPRLAENAPKDGSQFIGIFDDGEFMTCWDKADPCWKIAIIRGSLNNIFVNFQPSWKKESALRGWFSIPKKD